MKKEYSKDGITVQWDPTKCIHSTICFHGLPEVFNPSKRPWVNMDGADVQVIQKQVMNCPSGALKIKE